VSGTREGALKAAKTRRALYGEDYFSAMAVLGGKAGSGKKTAETQKKMYGEDWLSMLGSKGAKVRWTAVKKHKQKLRRLRKERRARKREEAIQIERSGADATLEKPNDNHSKVESKKD